MKVRIINENSTATAIYNVISDKLRNILMSKKQFTLDEVQKLMENKETRTFARLVTQMLTGDPAGATYVTISVIEGGQSKSAEDILNEIFDEKEASEKVEEAPNYDNIVDPDTENLS